MDLICQKFTKLAHLYTADALSQRQHEAMRAHLETCERCREALAEAQAIGVTGVPFFVFAGRLGVPGAQDVSVLRRAIAEARTAREWYRQCSGGKKGDKGLQHAPT